MDLIDDVLIPILIFLGALAIWDGFLRDVFLSLFNKA